MTRPLAATRLRQAAAAAYSAVVLADSPLAYWRFEDAFGSATAADSSGNARTMTLNGTRSLEAGSRNSRMSRVVAFPATGYGSVASAAWHQITGDLTLECWVMIPDAATATLTLMSCTSGGSGSANNRLYQWQLQTSGVKGMGNYHESGSNSGITNTHTPWSWTPGRWHHLVCVRDSAALTYARYADGVHIGTVSYGANATGGTNGEFNINRVADGNAQIGTASFDECAVYDTKLSAARIFEHYRAGRRTTGTAWERTVFMSNFLGADTATAAIDRSSRGRVMTFTGNAQLDTAQAPPGCSSSLLLDGTGDYVSVPTSADFEVAGLEFTIEAFVRIGTGGKIQTICAKRTTASSHFLGLDATEHLTFEAYYTGAAFVSLADPNAMSTGIWYHVCVQRIAGNVWTMHRDGVLVNSTTANQTILTNSTPWLIGRDGSSATRDWNGWIGPVRFTNGQSRYPGTDFTPPAAPFNPYE